ncbi:hypothetical protein SLEP1_g25408 [Rubroshorea leprosula]|uniref:Uncharacterized protein n=1 Tax=Rubroshorea leprosula TaxID=152421 RepID=A0AAV5JSL8_9ROSI|nr:hypothetical protein SLEP1_g25408 [Rubroshorea leprosula]
MNFFPSPPFPSTQTYCKSCEKRVVGTVFQSLISNGRWLELGRLLLNKLYQAGTSEGAK